MTSSHPVATARDLTLLLAGQTITQLGTQVSGVAVPLLAVLVLHATPFGVGLVNAAGSVAVLVIGLPAGAWLDRGRRRRVLIMSDLVRTVLLLSIPLAALLHVLGYGQLLVVALLAGFARVLFDVAFQSWLPSIVGADRVLRGNAALESARTAGQIVGPGVGGALVAAAGAATAFAVDATTFLVSAASLLLVGVREEAPQRTSRSRLRAEVADGLRVVLRTPVLRSLAVTSAVANFQFAVASSVTAIFLTRVLHLGPLVFGLLVGLGAGAAMLGAAVTPRLATAVGSARIVWVALAIAAPASLLSAFAQRGPLVSLLVVGTLIAEAGQIVYAITSVSLRQRICPPGILGRVNATMRVLILGLFPAGAVLGGLLGDAVGPRAVLVVAGLLGLACPLVSAGALRRIRDVEQLPPVAAG